MGNQSLLLAIVFAPILGAVIAPAIGRLDKSLRNGLALALAAIPLVFSCFLIKSALSPSPAAFSLPVGMGLNFSLLADSAAVFVAITSSLISCLIVFYSFGYISHYEHQEEYYSMVLLFLGGMMGIVFSQNLIFLYIFWEITAVCSWRLIGFFRKKTDLLRADKAFLLTFAGALLMLVGFIILAQQAGSFELSSCRDYFSKSAVYGPAVMLILAGIFSKSATLPFQGWLPDAGVAPSPVTALLHAAVLVKIGVYVFLRLFVVTIPLEEVWHRVIPWLAGASALVSGGAALIETDLKRIIAYSTISQIGFIFFGLSLGNEFAAVGGILYILMHGLAKAGLFLCAGIVEQNCGERDIRNLGGLVKTMPFTAGAFLVCAFSVMGIPPTGGFFSKYLVFRGAAESGQLGVSLLFVFCAFLTIVYLLRLYRSVFLGELKIEAKEKSPTMVWAVVILAVLSVAAGILVYYPAVLAKQAVSFQP